MALQDFTTYTEVDTGADVTVAANTITWVSVPIRQTTQTQRVFKDFGAAYFSGDFTHEFKVNFTSAEAGQTVYGAIWALGNAADDMTALDAGDNMALLAVKSSAEVWTLQLRVTENANIRLDASSALSASTDYYVTVIRDDDAGANSTGQVVVRICTTNYYGEAGASLVDTLTLDCSVGEQNDFQYLYATNDYDNITSAYQMSLVISDLDLNLGVEYAELAASGGFTLSGSATLTAAEVAELAASGGFALAGSATLTAAEIAELAASGGFTLSGSAVLTRAGWMRVLTDDDGATADVDVAKVGGGTRTLHFVMGLYTGYTDS